MGFKRFQLFLSLCLLFLPLLARAQYDGYGLKAAFYINDNLTNAAVSEVDPWLSFLWNGCPPQPNMSVSVFSAQWTGYVEPSYSEPYTFIAYVGGGVSVIVNGQTVISQWTDSANTSYQGSIALSAGVKYPLVVDYFTDGGNPTTDHIQLAWQSPSQPQVTIPRVCLLTGASIVPTPTPQTPSACQGTAPVTVNGVLSEWAWNTASGWNEVNHAVGGNTYSASAVFKTLWDTANLYFGVTVTDSVLTNTGSSTPAFENSAVEFYLDPTDSKSATQNSSCFEYMFRWNDTVPQELNGRTGGVSMSTSTLFAGSVTMGYVVEASIPWTILGISPSTGTVMGLDVGVDVNHNGGDCRDGQLIWNGGPDDYANASAYAQLSLGSACPTPISTPPVPTGGNPYVAPNPTSGPTVEFVYQMAEAGTAQIKVWNAWGNLCATINDAKPAGLASSILNISSFAPGHYFYRVVLNYNSGKKDEYQTQVLAIRK